MSIKQTTRYLARFKVETASTIAIGSGQTGLLNERLIARDASGLPYIPGTALAGIVRHTLLDNISSINENEPHPLEKVLGFQKGENGQGSRLYFSSGILIGPENKRVLEGLPQVDQEHEYFQHLRFLPERDHVRINHKGTAVQHAKFEQELVPRGVRFLFELELEGNEEDLAVWEEILSILQHPTFRVGAGTRKGFGALKVLDCQKEIYNLQNRDDLTQYLQNTASLNSSLISVNNEARYSENAQDQQEVKKIPKAAWQHYRLSIEPRDFFLFGAGVPDGEINMPPKKEAYFQWLHGKAKLSEEHFLIPATSIKGALAHRLAFHWNHLSGQTIEHGDKYDPASLIAPFDMEEALNELEIDLDIELMEYAFEATEWRKWAKKIDALSIEDSKRWLAFKEELEAHKHDRSTELYPVGEQNFAVKTILGYAKNSKDNEKEETGARGHLILSDLYLPASQVRKKVFTHVAIDRYTSGSIDGALFQEEVITTDEKLQLDLFLAEDLGVDSTVRQTLLQAFEATLDDLCEGKLPLGGNTTKGHGAFKGSWEKLDS